MTKPTQNDNQKEKFNYATSNDDDKLDRFMTKTMKGGVNGFCTGVVVLGVTGIAIIGSSGSVLALVESAPAACMFLGITTFTGSVLSAVVESGKIICQNTIHMTKRITNFCCGICSHAKNNTANRATEQQCHNAERSNDCALHHNRFVFQNGNRTSVNPSSTTQKLHFGTGQSSNSHHVDNLKTATRRNLEEVRKEYRSAQNFHPKPVKRSSGVLGVPSTKRNNRPPSAKGRCDNIYG